MDYEKTEIIAIISVPGIPNVSSLMEVNDHGSQAHGHKKSYEVFLE